MSVSDYYEDFDVLKKVYNTTAFGEEGSWVTEKTIQAAVGTLSKQELLIAEANENRSIFIVTVDKTNPIEYGTIIKRVNSGRTLRVTSNWRDAQPPSLSSFDWVQVNAEDYPIGEGEE